MGEIGPRSRGQLSRSVAPIAGYGRRPSPSRESGSRGSDIARHRVAIAIGQERGDFPLMQLQRGGIQSRAPFARSAASISTALTGIGATTRFLTTCQKSSISNRIGCPTWVRTMTRRVKVACATITPSGSEMRKAHAAAHVVSVKSGNGRAQRRSERSTRTLSGAKVCEASRFLEPAGITKRNGQG